MYHNYLCREEIVYQKWSTIVRIFCLFINKKVYKNILFNRKCWVFFLRNFFSAFSQLRICRPHPPQKRSDIYERCGMCWIEWKTEYIFIRFLFFDVMSKNSSKIEVIFCKKKTIFRFYFSRYGRFRANLLTNLTKISP